MINIKDLHKKAMEFADLAEIGKLKGMDEKDIQANYYKAFQFEKEAALKMPTNRRTPIPRPYLIRSAAALAYRATAYKEAEKMIALGFSEHPPSDVVMQLKEISDLIKKDQPSVTTTNTALQLKGKLLAANEDEFEIKIKNLESEEFYSIFVPAKTLKRIVRKYFSEMVTIQATSSPNGFIMLNNISLAA